MKLTSKLAITVAAGFLFLASTPRASATVELKLTDGLGHSVDLSENCGPGCVSFNGALGLWNINVTTGTSAPGDSPQLDLNTIDHHNAGAASTLTIELSDDAFTPAMPGFDLNIGGTISAHGTVTAALFGGTTDTKFDLSNQIGSTLSFSNPPVSFSGNETSYLPSLSVSPYALTEVATITFGANAGQASFDYSIDAVPEPASVLLLGGVLLFSGRAIRRKVRNGQRA